VEHEDASRTPKRDPRGGDRPPPRRGRQARRVGRSDSEEVWWAGGVLGEGRGPSPDNGRELRRAGRRDRPPFGYPL